MRFLLILLFSIPFIAHNRVLLNQQKAPNDKPTISFTFDDGKTSDLGGYKLADWHGRILKTLDKHHIKAVMFVSGHNKKSVNGKYVLSTWNNAGHFLANHTLNHPNFNNDEVTLAQYQNELLANELVIKQYSNFIKLFRYPYLKEGNTPEKVNGFRTFLKQHGYKVGAVTIDNSDWYIDWRLRNRLTENPQADIIEFKKYYINHLYEKAVFYDSISIVLTGRHINHSLLLHHNLVAGLFLDDVIMHFKANGWQVVDANTAFNDPIYNTVTTTVPAGESLTWSMAKQSGKFEKLLRYPAEGDQYEKEKMDLLGL
ncbi:MAG: polysaccharide deacetylase family protein [Bacteroidia bacterium]|nr:polysaccharide deacetylase family protein [Bacteroidia bacterium]MBP9688361.1 polysaccharide deacetylase family protein [Bacteroidia bacterium]